MGNICFCCPSNDDLNDDDVSANERDGLLQRRKKPSSSSRILGIIPVDDDWADEIWYDALEHKGSSSIRNTHSVDSGMHYHDAQEEEEEEHQEKDEAVFLFSDDELSILKNALAEQFPDDSHYMSDAYLRSVASKPYSKDPTQRRPLEYTLEKLIHVLQWRHENRASQLPTYIDHCNTLDYKQQPKFAQAMVESLNNGSMYWHGLTKGGRPVLWIRTNRKFWYPNVQAEVDALIAMADAGIMAMPPGVTDFVVVSHSYKPPPPNPTFAFQMLKGLVKGYPDRMQSLMSAPVSGIVEFCMNLLLPLMPGRLAHKFHFYNEAHAVQHLTRLLQHGLDDIPTFLGGPNKDHDVYYPEQNKCPSRGQGMLTFDWYGMKERLQEQCDLFAQQQQEQQHQQEQQQKDMILHQGDSVDGNIIVNTNGFV
ncbi:CRAL/TRIO domain [Seminavis robusta]|uniref:CRAL/TRIO domain n=1 Tax=Seminavis robusta TaxID=568900 RepID=A0A9N8DJP0_9STRA|nr:CRAL/TRIO domain [Seminavis robusta]|eukprot:Sro118_g057770.1 CRAL/TRIO domain (422) ;mRNA; f:69905-71170